MFVELDLELFFHRTSTQNSTDRSRPKFFHHIRITSFQVSSQPFDEQITQRSQKYTFLLQMLKLNELILKPFQVVLLLCNVKHADSTKNTFQNGTWKMIYIREKINIFALLECFFPWLCPVFYKKPSKCHLDFDYFCWEMNFSAVLDYQTWDYHTVTGALQQYRYNYHISIINHLLLRTRLGHESNSCSFVLPRWCFSKAVSVFIHSNLQFLLCVDIKQWIY